MNPFLVTVIALSFGFVQAQPISQENGHQSIWKGTSMDAVVQQYQQQCLEQPDSGACIKVKVLNLVDEVLGKDAFKAADGISIVPNENKGKVVITESGRSSDIDVLEHLESYVKNHDVVIKSPVAFLQGTTLKFSPRNLDHNELNFSIKLPTEDENAVAESRGRKSKLKKILVPILVFVLLKAMTLIPLAIGVLGLKAWNALQLSFISFLVSISLAIFQLCKKIAHDSAASPIATHIPIDASHYAAARNLVITPEHTLVSDVAANVDAQNLVYNAYAQS